MYNELLNQLEKRIQEAVETIEMYRLEIAELKEKNSELENQHEVWEDKLSSLIQKFETLNQTDETDTGETSDVSASSDSSYTYESTSDTESEEESQNEPETSSYSSTTSFGSQAVASSYHYSNQDE